MGFFCWRPKAFALSLHAIHLRASTHKTRMAGWWWLHVENKTPLCVQLTRFCVFFSSLHSCCSFFPFAKDTKTLLIFHKSNLTFITDVNRSIECIDLRFLLNVNGRWKRTIVCSLTTLKIPLLLKRFFYMPHNKIHTVLLIDEQINKYTWIFCLWQSHSSHALS